MKKSEICSCCGSNCTGKLRIQARKNKDYPFCHVCFEKLRNKTLKEIRKEIKWRRYI